MLRLFLGELFVGVNRASLVGLAWLLSAASVSAQVGTGSINGFISDDSGARLRGATVMATGAALMGKRTGTSDQQGHYRLLDLPSGEYEVEAQLPGFARFEKRHLVVRTGLSIRLDFTMRIGDFSETVEVRGEAPLLESEKAMRTLHLDGDFLRALPLAAGHDWWDALRLAPGVLLKEGGADLVETHGAGVSSNVFLLDGIDISSTQLNTSITAQLPPDSLADVWITTSGHDAASRMAVGSQLGVVTRSGGNQTHGAATIDLQFKELNAANVPGGGSADRTNTRPAMSLGGPVVRNRLWYFGAYQYIRERQGIARTEQDLELLRLFQPGFVPYDSKLGQHRLFTKATYQPTAADQVVLSVQFDHLARENEQWSPRFTHERAGSAQWGGPMFNATWRRQIGGRAAIEAQAGFFSKRYESALPQGDGPNVRIFANLYSSVGRFFGSGPPIVELGNPQTVARQRQRRSNVNATLRYFPGEWGGNHELTVGINFLPQNEYSFLYTSANDGFTLDERVLVQAANPAAGARTFHRRNVNPVTVSGDGRSSRAAGFFAQDSWRPGRRFVVNAGLRIDSAQTFDAWGDAIQSSWQAGPRFGVTYRPSIDGRTIVRASFNRMFDAATNRATLSLGLLQQGTRDEYDLDGDGSFETVFTVPAVLERPPAVPGSSRGFAAPDLRQPRADEMTVGLSHQLPFEATVDATFVGRVYRDRIVAIDTNGIYEDGRFFGYREPAFNQIYEVRNGTDNWLVYRALELSLHRGVSRDLQFLIGYSYAGQGIEGTWDRNDPASFLQPRAFRNRKGVGSVVGFSQGQSNSLAPNQTNSTLLGSGVPPHMLKVNVAYLAPLGLTVGVSHLFQMGQYSGPILTLIPQSGTPHPPTVTLSNGRVVSNPLATQVRFFYPTRDDGQLQLPSLNVLNVRMGKRFKWANQTLEGALEVFNLFNRANALAFDLPTLIEGQPAAFVMSYTQPPRAGLITARWTF
jgi:hypothetical protein